MPHKDPIIKQQYHNNYSKKRFKRIGDEREASGMPRVPEWKIESVKRYRVKHRDKINTKKTAKRLEKLTYLTNLKQSVGCKYCPESHPACLDFHHRDPSQKISGVARMTSHSWENLLAEVEKCDVVCKNCHAKIHWIEKEHASAIPLLKSDHMESII